MPKIGDIWDVGDVQEGRHKQAALKRRIYEEDFLEDIRELIGRRMVDPEARGLVQEHAAETVNFLRSIVTAIAVVYDYGCRRYLRGASAAASAAFSDLVRETDAPLLQSRWNVWGWLLGPTFVVPAMRDGAMRLTFATPDVSWARFQGDEIEAVLWRAGKLYIEVSADGWRYFDEKGQPVERKEFGTDRNGRVALNLAAPPIATFRTDLPAKDWWSSSRHRGLAAGTLEACYWWAHLQWIRKSQSRKLLVAKARKDKLIGGQNATDPEIPYLYDGEPDEAAFEVHDFNTPPADHLSMIRFIGEQLAEREGIPGAEVTFDNSSDGDMGVVSLQLRREKLAHVHMQQVPHMVRGEADLWPAVVAVAKSAGHRHAAALPPPDEIREMLTVEFPEPEVVTDPKARLELDAEKLRLGLTSPVKIMQRHHPSLTLEECKALQREHLTEYAELLDFIASRNLPSNPGRATQTLAEAQGSVGGQTRVANQQEENPA